MHQQEVVGVGLPAHILGHAGRHGHGGHARRADEGIDSAPGHLVHDFAHQQAADGGEHEGDNAQHHDHQGLEGQEPGGHGGGTHADAQKQGDDVHQGVLGGVAQPLRHAGFLEQVAEHEAADQRGGGGDEQNDKGGHRDGEDDLLHLGHVPGLLHLHLPLLLRGQGPHQGLLDHGDEGHIGVGGDGDGAQEGRGQLGGQIDGGGPVRAADDADGGGHVAGEAQQAGAEEGEEHAHLSRRAHQHGGRPGDQGPEIGHGAHADEDQAGVHARLHADIQDIQQAAQMDDVGKGQLRLELGVNGGHHILIQVGGAGQGLGVGVDVAALLRQRIKIRLDLLCGVAAGPGEHVVVVFLLGVATLLRPVVEGVVVDSIIGALVDVGVPHAHMVQPRAGDVGEQHAESDAHQQQGLELLADAQVEQHAGQGNHDQVFPAARREEPGKAGLGGQLGQGL